MLDFVHVIQEVFWLEPLLLLFYFWLNKTLKTNVAIITIYRRSLARTGWPVRRCLETLCQPFKMASRKAAPMSLGSAPSTRLDLESLVTLLSPLSPSADSVSGSDVYPYILVKVQGVIGIDIFINKINRFNWLSGTAALGLVHTYFFYFPISTLFSCREKSRYFFAVYRLGHYCCLDNYES